MAKKILLSNLRKYIEEKDIINLRKIVNKYPPADIAEVIDDLEEKEVIKLFRWIEQSISADIFTYLDYENQQSIIKLFTQKEMQEFVEELYIDEIIDIIEEMPANIVRKIIRAADSETRKEINSILKYPEDTAGSIMNINELELEANWTVKFSLKKIKEEIDDLEITDTLFAIGKNRELKGIVYLKDLIFNKDDILIKDIIDQRIVVAKTLEDQEEVANKFKKYDLTIIPVVNKDNHLVGNITVDDVVHVLEEEATKDIHKLAGINPIEKTYFQTSIWKMVRSRSVWLLFLMISATLSQVVISAFLGIYHANSANNSSENTKLAFIAVAYLVPVLSVISGTSGNAGSQSSTMIVRALSLKEVQVRDYARVLWKELRVALVAGFILMTVNFIRMVIIYLIQYKSLNIDEWKSIITLSVALYITVVIAKLVGATLPIVAKSLKLDPAIMAAPLLTTLVDALSTSIFMSLGLLFYMNYL